jgi:hypothetical protein
MTELANIQHWLTSIIIKPGPLNERIRLADQVYKLDNDKVVRPSITMSSGQKIGIYARGYVLRLMECMLAEYPALHYLLGDDLFNTFVRTYLINLPSRSPDLYDLGKNFAAFLKASQPKNGSPDNEMFDLPVDLAKLERALAEVSRVKGLEGKEIVNETDDPMLSLFGTVNYQTSPCLMLLKLQFPLVDFVRAVQHGNKAMTPEKKDSFVAISRKNYAVNMHEVEAWQWYFLQALQNTNSYTNALDITSETCDIAKDTLMADLLLWLPLAISFGYVYVAE